MSELDPVIHQATRLRIMAALYRNREANFTGLRDGLGLTDGNLASHAQKLEEAGYLEARRALVGASAARRGTSAPGGALGVSFEVRYRITPRGSEAFRAYVDALQGLLADAALP